ncbi:cilia- and flagella-associated protein 184 [Garra rufa]|uniref:cilia- and flagella-associated protein 184 n=1 Tax=Garra rufa TaxID=137080 RepID=UPI003CCE6FD7
MEEGSLEVKHGKKNTQVENTETSEDPEAASAQVEEEETDETEPPNISEGDEDDVVKQDSQLSMDVLKEDVSIAETKEPQIDETEFGQHMITEEEDWIEPETLEDTEGPEIEHLIDDLLSREDTEDEEEKEEDRLPAPDPGNERTSPPNESTVPGEGDELNINNEEHMDLLHELEAESEKLSKLNLQLQTKIAEYLSKKTDDKRPRLEEDISNQEQYQNYIDLIEELKVQHHSSSEFHQQRTEELRQQSLEKLKQVEQELRSLAALKYEAAMTALSGKVGKQAALAEVEQLQADELKQEDKLASVCLNNIKLKNKICQLETELKSKRELADGLLLMDFEQLKTENQTFKDKLKERSEELLRLKRKVACSVQGISHVKEKLHFMQIENKVKHTQLAKADALVALKREVLTRTRQARDGLRADNLNLQQRCGLLGNTPLLQDYEEKVDASECRQQRLEMLKRRHAELMLKCAGVKQKIEQSKPEGP